MLAQILSALSDIIESTPEALAVPGVVAVALSLGSLAVLEYFKPVGKRRLQDGRKPHLPPGPKGQPLFGSLLMLKNAREDPEHEYVSLSTVCNLVCAGLTLLRVPQTAERPDTIR